MPSAACPLCSSTPADLVDHLRRELLFPALRCLLCPVTFFSLHDAEGHFAQSLLASHPGQSVQVVQLSDAEKEKRLLGLAEEAKRRTESSVNEDSEKQAVNNSSPGRASEPSEPDIKKKRWEIDGVPKKVSESSTEALPHEVEQSSPSKSFETRELFQSIDPRKQESASDESNSEEWLEINLSSADQAVQSDSYDKQRAPEAAYQIAENHSEPTQSPSSTTLHDGTRSSLGSEVALLDQGQVGTLAELPAEVKGFHLEAEDTKPKPRNPDSKTGNKVDCLICSRSVAKGYRQDHVSTKHLRVSLWACRHCSYRNQHWADTIGLKEHVSRKHQLPLTFAFTQHFEDLRLNHKEGFASLLKRAFPDYRLTSLSLLAGKLAQSLTETTDTSSEDKSTNVAKSLLANQLLCKLCQVPVSVSETRNHVMLKHIKAVGFRCSLCNFEVPYWMSEFKQMNRHVETEHREAGLWQDIFVDLRKPHYPALKDFLRQCFDIQARCEAREVYRLKAKPKPAVVKPKRRPQKASLLPGADETMRLGSLVCKCGGKDAPGGQTNSSNAEKREAHIWAFHGNFSNSHSHRCRICLRGLTLSAARGHIEAIHKVPCSRQLHRRYIQDVRTDEEKAQVTALVEANYALSKGRTAADLADQSYEALTKAEKQSLYQERMRQSAQPISQDEILRIKEAAKRWLAPQVAEQRWLACRHCPAFVAASDVERHILADHLKRALVRCRHCDHCYPATRHWQCLDQIKEHLWTKHNLASDVRSVQLRDTLKAHIRRVENTRDALYHNLVRQYFGKGAEALGGVEQRARGFVPPLSAKSWPADVPQPQRLPSPDGIASS